MVHEAHLKIEGTKRHQQPLKLAKNKDYRQYAKWAGPDQSESGLAASMAAKAGSGQNCIKP